MKPIENHAGDNAPEPGSAGNPPCVLSTRDGELNIREGIIQEDPDNYLQNIRECLDEYLKNPQPVTTLTLHPHLLNGITTHYLYGIIRKLYSACDDFTVKWEFKAGDEKCLEQGQILASLCKAKFRFVRIPNREN